MLAAVLSLSKHVHNTAKPIDWHVIYRKISKMLLCLIWDHIPYITLKLFQDMEQQCWMEFSHSRQTLRTDKSVHVSTDNQDDMWSLDLIIILQRSLMDRINAALVRHRGRLLWQHHRSTSDNWSNNTNKLNWSVHVLIFFGGVVTLLQEGSGLEFPFLGGVSISMFSPRPWGFFLGTTASSHSPKTFIWGLIGYSKNPPSLKG